MTRLRSAIIVTLWVMGGVFGALMYFQPLYAIPGILASAVLLLLLHFRRPVADVRDKPDRTLERHTDGVDS